MTPELDRLLSRLEPASSENDELRLKFGLHCAQRVAHLLEESAVVDCLNQFQAMVEGRIGKDGLPELAARANELANRHQGSRSLDGVGHAAVSATYACAKAIAGNARQAAEYSAYAAVYGQGGYGATTDAEAFIPEYEWQAQHLAALRRLPTDGG